MSNKTELEKLKEICDKIGYNYKKYRQSITIYQNDMYNFYSSKSEKEFNYAQYEAIKDVREIIFTSDFINKYSNYLVLKKGIESCKSVEIVNGVLGELFNPVDYLYKYIFN